MYRMAISQWSIVTKLAVMVILIFISVGGILAVNTASFFQVKDSLVVMIDRDVGKIIKNVKLKRELNEIFSKASVLIHTFPEREGTLEGDKDRLVETLQNDVKLLKDEESNLQYSLQEYTQQLMSLLDQCIKINATLGDLYPIERSLDRELANLDDIVVEKELILSVKETEEAYALKQLGLMLPAYREIYFEIIIQLIKAERAYLEERAIKENYERKILSLLDEFNTGLNATTIAWKEIDPRIKDIMALVSQFKAHISKLFVGFREFSTTLSILQGSQEKVLMEIGVFSAKIAENTKNIRLKTAERVTTSMRTTVLLSALVTVFLVLVGLFTMRLVRPIKRLNIGVKRVGGGDLNFKVKVDSKDEIGQLAESFNQMTADLRKSTVSKEYVENIITSMIDTLIVVSPEGTIQKVNQATYELLHYQAEELIGQPLEKVLRREDEEHKNSIQKTDIEQLIQDGFIREVERIYLPKDGGEIPVLFSGSVMRDHDGQIQGIVCVALDITDRKRTEAALRESEQKVATFQRMEAIGTLAGGIAHDFNNLLMGIQGNASLMLYGIDSAHPHYDGLTHIEQLVDSGARLSSQLLGYARKGKYEVKPINLNQLVEQTTNTFGRAKKEIMIRQELQQDLCAIEADLGQIEQVLINLYVNAADAMPDGGKLILKTVNVTHEDMKCGLYNPKPGNYVLLEVTDTGIGMDKMIQERIFDPFFTTKEMGRGTGLGLASVYGIVKGHGGYIDVYSEKGKGSTFNVYLPALDQKTHKCVETEMKCIKGSGIVLLVDDEKALLNVGAKLLKKLGYTVLEAAAGAEAVEIYKEDKDKIDIVILDMIMPDMSGGEVYDRISEINPEVKVLLSSGYSIDGKATEILKRGCDGFIQKPFRLQELSERIKEVLAKQQRSFR